MQRMSPLLHGWLGSRGGAPVDIVESCNMVAFIDLLLRTLFRKWQCDRVLLLLLLLVVVVVVKDRKTTLAAPPNSTTTTWRRSGRRRRRGLLLLDMDRMGVPRVLSLVLRLSIERRLLTQVSGTTSTIVQPASRCEASADGIGLV